MSSPSNPDIELSARFDKLASLIEATLQVQNQGGSKTGTEMQSKLPEKIADVVMLEAAKASIAKTSEFVKGEIDKRLDTINQIISGYESAFSKEKSIVNALMSGEPPNAYSSVYKSAAVQGANPSAGPAQTAAGAGAPAAHNPSNSAAKTASVNAGSAPNTQNYNLEKVNKMLADMVQKVKDSSEEDKQVMSKYVSDLEAIFKELQGNNQNNPYKK